MHYSTPPTETGADIAVFHPDIEIIPDMFTNPDDIIDDLISCELYDDLEDFWFQTDRP